VANATCLIIQYIKDYVIDITLRTVPNSSSMFKRPTADAAESIPANVRRSLVESLFADSGTMVMGAVATSVSALLIMALTRSAAPDGSQRGSVRGRRHTPLSYPRVSVPVTYE
jgi:hypothetical protein